MLYGVGYLIWAFSLWLHNCLLKKIHAVSKIMCSHSTFYVQDSMRVRIASLVRSWIWDELYIDGLKCGRVLSYVPSGLGFLCLLSLAVWRLFQGFWALFLYSSRRNKWLFNDSVCSTCIYLYFTEHYHHHDSSLWDFAQYFWYFNKISQWWAERCLKTFSCHWSLQWQTGGWVETAGLTFINQD